MLAPAVTGDQTKYQLAYPKLFAAAHGLVPTPWSFWGQQQFLANWVFAAGYAVQGESLARLLNGLTGLLAVLAVGRLVERHLLRGAGLVAAMLLMTQPMSWSLMTRAGADLLLVANAALAVSAFLDWRRRADDGALRRLGLLAGLAGGTKVMGMLWPALLGIGVLLRGGRPLRERLVAAVVFAALAGAVAAPPYVRNLVEVGNPLHPFAHSLFGGRHWTPAAAAYLDEYYRQYRVQRAARRDGSPYAGLEWLRFPWDLTMYPESFERATRQSLDIGPFAVAFLPAAVWAARRSRRRQAVLLMSAVCVAVIAGGAWAHPRYVLPALALWVAAGVAGARRVLGRRGWALVVAVTVAGQLVVTSRLLPPLWPDQVRVATGRMTREAFLERHSWRFRFWRRASAVVPPDGLVLVLEKIPHPYFIERPFVLGSYLEQTLIDYRTIGSAAALRETALALGVTHVAIDVAGLAAGADPFEARVSALWRDFAGSLGPAAVQADGHALFALARPAGEPS
jgi:4-amino-4-deoxy-L-arabinose transferase-like glycosyltransferase